MVSFTILFYCARQELPSCAVGSICSVHLVTMAAPFMCPACQSEGGCWLRKFRACDVEIPGDIHQDVFIPSVRIKDFSDLGPDLDTKLPWFFMKFSILAGQVQTFFCPAIAGPKEHVCISYEPPGFHTWFHTWLSPPAASYLSVAHQWHLAIATQSCHPYIYLFLQSCRYLIHCTC